MNFGTYQSPSQSCEDWYTLGDKLQQHVAATRRSEKSLRVCWRILVKIRNIIKFCPGAEQVAKNQIRQNLCDLLLRQNSIAERKIITKILQYTQSDLSLRRVAATCCFN